MSGGSYSYKYSHIDELTNWVSVLHDMAERCREWASQIEKVYEFDIKKDRPATDMDRAQILVRALRLEAAADELAKAVTRVRDLEETMHDVEWIVSGDYSPDHWCRK